jgi:hypothetical protein
MNERGPTEVPRASWQASVGPTVTFWCALVLLCAPLAISGIARTRSLSWPEEPDVLRDAAQAQTCADGHPLSDPFYRGEWAWYPPLVPWTVAGVSRVLHMPVPMTYARLGAYLNALAFLAFGALVARLFGPWVALAAVLDTLYIRDPRLRPWAAPSYSTTLYAGAAVLTLFCLTLLAYRRAVAGTSRWRCVLTGVLLGLTFLGHVAPAIILACVFCCDGIVRLRGDVRVYRQLALMAVPALVVASPLLYTIVGHYHLATRNPAPGSWDWRLGSGLNWETYLAVAAAVYFVRRARGPNARLFLCWVAAAGALFVAATIASRMGHSLGVPRHHFLYYLKAGQSVVLAWAVVRISEQLRDALNRLGTSRHIARVTTPTVIVTLAVSAWFLAPTRLSAWLAQQRDTTPVRPRAYRTAAYAWLRAHATDEAVVLASDSSGIEVVGPAGAKVVATFDTHSNPYVDWAKRTRDRNAMLAALADEQQDRFLALAEEYQVTHVLRLRRDGPWLALKRLPALALAYRGPGVRIYKLRNH